MEYDRDYLSWRCQYTESDLAWLLPQPGIEAFPTHCESPWELQGFCWLSYSSSFEDCRSWAKMRLLQWLSVLFLNALRPHGNDYGVFKVTVCPCETHQGQITVCHVSLIQSHLLNPVCGTGCGTSDTSGPGYKLSTQFWAPLLSQCLHFLSVPL
jgi:hypothetical protein